MTARERKKLAKRLAARLKREGNPYCPYAPLVQPPRYGIPAIARGFGTFAAYAEMLQRFHEALYRSLGLPSGLLLPGWEKEPPAPDEPLTLSELKAALGGDGADLERRAFTQEGGIRE